MTARVANLLKRIVYSDMRVEVWMEPGLPASQGRIYREKAEGRFGPGRLCLVLGAGNQSSIGPLDVLYKLFVEDEVVVLKTNPVNEYLAPFFRRAFRSLIDAGYLDLLQGGADAGRYLCRHPSVDTIHLTGSDRTHDAIVWGDTVEEQERRKAAGQPMLANQAKAQLARSLGRVPPDLPLEEYLIQPLEAYVDFARQNPELYTAMFLQLTIGASEVPTEYAPDDSLTFLVRAIERGIDEGLFHTTSRYGVFEIAYSMWAMDHGMAMFQVRFMRNFAFDFEAAEREAVRVFLNGLKQPRE